MKRKDRHASIKRLTVCAMLTALGVIFLGIGALIEVLDISMAVIASICVIIPMIEYGKGAPWMVYAAISVLSLLILPSKFPAALFALFAGFYPILKEVKLTDYKVRVLDGADAATSALVRVLITSTYKKRRYTTVGVSRDVVDASWKALEDSIEFLLMKSEEV